MVDFGPASRGIGIGIGIIGLGIGLEHLSNSVKNIEKPRNSKSKPYTPLFESKTYTSRQYSLKPYKWKL